MANDKNYSQGIIPSITQTMYIKVRLYVSWKSYMFQKELYVSERNSREWKYNCKCQGFEIFIRGQMCIYLCMHQLNVKKANITQENQIFISEENQLLFNVNLNAFQILGTVDWVLKRNIIPVDPILLKNLTSLGIIYLEWKT